MGATRNRQGFSLAEVLCCLVLLGVVLGLSLGFQRGAKQRSDTRALALHLADQLRGLRQQAMTSGHPCGVALPSAGGSRAVATALHVLQGESQPRLSQVVPIATDGATAQLFLGQYSGPGWSTSRPQGLLGNSPDLSSWNIHGLTDPVIYFSPDGSVFSNAPHDQGRYRLVVAHSIEATAGSPAQLTRVHAPTTVTLTLLGAIQVEPGLPGGDGSLLAASAFPPSSPASGSSPGSGNQPPVFVTPYLSVAPRAEESTLANVSLPGSNYTVALDGTMTVECFATDPDGDPLFCRWSCTGPAGSGAFSASQGTPMSWDSGRNCWVGRWSWRPPTGADYDQLYTMNCEVYDSHGLIANSTPISAQLPKSTTIVRRKMVYALKDLGDEGIWICNWDGSNARRLVGQEDIGPNASDFTFPVLNSESTRVAFACKVGANYQIWRCGTMGQELEQVASYNRIGGLVWDPRDDYLYTVDDDGANTCIREWEADTLGQVTPSLLASFPNGGTMAARPYIHAHRRGRMLMVQKNGIFHIIWTHHSNQPGKVELHPCVGSEPSFGRQAGVERIVYDKGASGSETLHWRAFSFDEASCTSILDPVENELMPGHTGYQSPMLSEDGEWVTGQATGAGLRIFLCELSSAQPMVLNLPGTKFDYSRFSW